MSLTCTCRVVSAATLIVAVVASGTDSGPSLTLAQGSNWNVPATAAIFSEQKKNMPKNATQAVELLRFVTAYKKGVEALVDITPYSALLRASADTDGDLTFFAFIDTWVGNNTPETKPVMRLDNAGKCAPSAKQQEAWGGGGGQGNGWQVDANLVFWPKTGAIDTRPRESITLSSGYYGSYSIGSITAHEGTVAAGGASIELKHGADLTGTLDAEVYACPGGAKDVESGIKMGQLAKRVHSSENEDITGVVDQVYKDLVGDSMTVLTVASSDIGSHRVEVNLDAETMHLAPGMPVWYEGEDLLTNGTTYGSFPRSEPIGKVVSVLGSRATLEISGACFPGEATHWLPRLKLEKSHHALTAARRAADSIKTLKQRMIKIAKKDEEPENFISLLNSRRATEHLEADASVFKPFLVAKGNDDAYAPLPILGQIDLGFLNKDGADCAPPMVSFLQTAEKEVKMGNAAQPYPGSANATAQRLLRKAGATGTGAMQMSDGDKVCILARRSTGRVFERSFDMPTFVPAAAGVAAAAAAANVASQQSTSGDRVLLQFAVTGHGWSGSTEQCGEFCHAVYHIKVNGHDAAKVTEWRDDCEKNPVSGQYGTWEIHRDGWCPGSVEPGLYIDMTKWAKRGQNQISVDLSVWSSKSRKYVKYTNYGNYIGGGDGAVLFVGATLFVYDGDAADAIMKQSQAYTAAEAALRDGSSMPKALQPPEEVNGAFGASLLESSETATPFRLGRNGETRRIAELESLYRGMDNSPVRASIAELAAGVLRQEHAASRRAKPHSRALRMDSFLGRRSTAHNNALNGRYDFEARAPWYTYDAKREGAPGSAVGATVVPAITSGLIQINSREIRAKVQKSALPEEWGYAALHISLNRPGHRGSEELEMDNWDRMGSLGLLFEENAASTKDPHSRVKLRPSSGRKLTSSWKLSRHALL